MSDNIYDMIQTIHTAKNITERALLEQRKIFLWEQVDDESSKNVVQQLYYLEGINSGEPVHMYLNCPGGVVTAGFAMLDAMNSIKSPVYTYCIGFAASMGSILLSAGEKGHRYIYPTAEVMIHQPSTGGFQARAKDIEINTKHILRTKKVSAKILADNCDKTVKQILEDFDRDYWMNAEEALEYGIVDKLVTN